MKRWLIPVIVVVIVAIGVGAFFGGRAAGGGTPTVAEAMKVIQNMTAAERQTLGQGGGTGGQIGASNRAGGFGGLTSGSIISSDASSITVKLSDGSTKIILYSDSTTISTSTKGSSADLTAGQEVRVTGTTNSDGSITATNIQTGSGVGIGAAPPAGGAPPAGAAGSTGTTAASGADTSTQ